MTWKEMFQPLGTVMTTMCTGHLQLTAPSFPLLHGLLGNPISTGAILPKSPPYTAFLGNLPYAVTEDSIKEFFRGLNISAVHLPREPSNPERLKGFGYAEFENLDSLLSALSLNEESLDSFDDYLPRRGDDSFGDKYRDCYDSDRYQDGYQDGPHRDMDRYGGPDRYDDQGSRDYDRGYNSRIGSGRRAFGSGYHRDDDYRGGGDCYEDHYDRLDDRPWGSRDDYSQDDYRHDDRAAPPKENAWVKRSSNPPARSQSSDTEQQSPTSGGWKVVPAQPSEEGLARKDENKIDGMSVQKGQTGNSSHGPGDGGNKDHWKESDRKDGKKDQDSRSVPEPKKPEENPSSKFSSESKYAALSVDDEDENEEDYAD
ncbi:Eukaryotic translation initiation factor 4B [Heterocephalus glaber]|uniref:Eukaryotic translation initiation factor 4B n=1 Tax=Heterocephalus glaber TaxID=10181 RepID=G5APD8_HETGA|nr:Eukaryotic translation initiation factor 4B [Heterocephalus glaber]